MATRDQLHPHVVRALRKDGWTITHDPYVVPFAGTYTEIDLGAEKLFAAEKVHDPERTLYLAIPQFIHRTFFADEMVRQIVGRFGLKLLVFSPETESVITWTN